MTCFLRVLPIYMLIVYFPVDSGRELKITAGFKHVKAKKGTALFDLIEEYEEKPIETP